MNCNICLENFTVLNNLTCSHRDIYCQKCLDKWGKHKCPSCLKPSESLPDWKEWIINEIEDERSRDTIQDSIETLTEEDFKFLGNYNPPQGSGFMFNDNSIVKEIGKKVDSKNIHSGCSYAWTMRTLQYYSRIWFSL